MNLLTKLYLAFGFILLVFTFVTITYVFQSKEIESDTVNAIKSTEIMRLSESLEKTIVNCETGVRGFQVSDNEAFLEPYYSGLLQYEAYLDELNALLEDKAQQKRLLSIDSTFSSWRVTFAEPSVALQKKSLQDAEARTAYTDFFNNVARQGAGKKILDSARSQFKAFDAQELQIKQRNLRNLDNTMELTIKLATLMTLLSILVGIIVAIMLGRIISRRLKEMAAMAKEVSLGHFDVKISDTRNDEISEVTHWLNIMAEKLNTSFESLHKMNKELDQFAYVVSHDLKAPLRAINNLAEWIQEDLPILEPDVKRNLELMRGRVMRMENLINGILDYSKIGRKKIPETTVEVEKLLSEISDSIACGSNASIELETPLPTLLTEAILLQQVFSNLISNAIKYNDKFQPLIRIGCRYEQAWAAFYVQDNGPGIPSQYHEKVFGMFQTVEARDTRESTGVGLAIVKKIIAEKNGTVHLESEDGQGCRFTFTWPMATAVTAVREAQYAMA